MHKHILWTRVDEHKITVASGKVEIALLVLVFVFVFASHQVGMRQNEKTTLHS